MANVKITAMTDGAPADGTEIIPTSKSAAPRRITVDDIKTYIIDAIEALSAGSTTTGSDSVFILQGGVLKPLDIDVIEQYVADTLWGKAAETVVDALDVLLLKDGGSTEKTVTVAILATYIRTAIEAAILDVSDLADGSGAIATSDYMLVTQGTTGKRIQISDLKTLIYATLATTVTGLADVGTPTDTDYLYLVRGSTGYYLNLDDLATYVQAALTLSGSGSTGSLASWQDANTIEAVYSVALASGGKFAAGTETALPTTAAVRQEIDALVDDAGLIGEALAATDTFLVYNASLTTQAKSAISRIWDYILANETLDEDTMTSDSASKLATQQSIKAYVDTVTNFLTLNLLNLLLSAGTDIGEALVDADLIPVYNDSAGANRKCAMTRVADYVAQYAVVDELYIDASEMTPRTTGGCAALATDETTTNKINHRYLAFDGAAEEFAQFKRRMPPQWNRGTIKAKFYWRSAAGSTAADTVEWTLKAGALSDDDAADTALGTQQVISDTLLVNDGTDIHLSGATPAITVGGTPALGDLVTFEVSRNVAGTDDMTEDAWLLGVAIQFTRDQAVTAW